MAREEKVIWPEAMFLQSQHFEHQDRYFEKLPESRVSPATPYSWGFAKLALDESVLAPSSASGIFLDGTPFDLPATNAGLLLLDVQPSPKAQPILLAVSLHRANAREAQLARCKEFGFERYTVIESKVADNLFDGLALIQLRLMLQTDPTDAYACCCNPARWRSVFRSFNDARLLKSRIVQHGIVTWPTFKSYIHLRRLFRFIINLLWF